MFVAQLPHSLVATHYARHSTWNSGAHTYTFSAKETEAELLFMTSLRNDITSFHCLLLIAAAMKSTQILVEASLLLNGKSKNFGSIF